MKRLMMFFAVCFAAFCASADTETVGGKRFGHWEVVK